MGNTRDTAKQISQKAKEIVQTIHNSQKGYMKIVFFNNTSQILEFPSISSGEVGESFISKIDGLINKREFSFDIYTIKEVMLLA